MNVPIITAYNIPLSLQASWLIQQGMFDAAGGRFSGLLAWYKYSIDGTEYTASYVMLPNVGIAILVDDVFSLYVHKKYRRQGYAKQLAKLFNHNFPHLLNNKKIETQTLTTKILNELAMQK